MVQAVSRFSPRRHKFGPGSVHMGFVVDKVALGQAFVRVLRFSPLGIIPSVLNSHHHPPAYCSYHSGKWPKLGNFPKISALLYTGEHLVKNYFHVVFEGSVLYCSSVSRSCKWFFSPKVFRLMFCTDFWAAQCMLHVRVYAVLRVEILYMFCVKYKLWSLLTI
jgi:hypothetical protein